MMEEKNSKKLIFIVALVCVVLCIPIGILIGKFVYDKPVEPNNNEINNKLENPNEGNDEGIVKDVNLISKLEDFTKHLSDFSIPGQTVKLYKNFKLTDIEKTYFALANIKNNWMDLTEAEKNMDKHLCHNGYVTYETANNMFNRMFEGTISKDLAMLPYSFEEWRYYTGGCGGFLAADLVKAFNYNYTLENDIYYVYQYVGLLTVEGQLYADVEKTKILEGKTASSDETIASDVYELFTKYRLAFKLVNDNFIFHGIEKI